MPFVKIATKCFGLLKIFWQRAVVGGFEIIIRYLSFCWLLQQQYVYCSPTVSINACLWYLKLKFSRMCHFSYFVSHTRQQAIYVHFEKILKKQLSYPTISYVYTVKCPKFAMNGIILRGNKFICCQKENNFTQLAIRSTFHCSGYCEPLFTIGWSPVGAPHWRKTQKSCSSFCTLFVKSYLF